MKKIITLCALVICFSSCDKDFLSAKPDVSLLIPSSLKDFSALLDSEAMINVPGLCAIATDDYYTTASGLLAYNSPLLRNSYLWASDIYEGMANPDWNVSYKSIFYANVALEGLDKLNVKPNEQKEWNTLKGSALFFRAFAYYHLAQVFAKPYDVRTADSDLGIPLRLKADINDRPDRGSLSQIYKQIITDLEQTLALLPTSSIYKTQPDLASVYAFLAVVHLTMQNYELALPAAEQALKLNNKLINYNSLTGTVARPFPLAQPVNKNVEILFYAPMNLYAYAATQAAQTYIDVDLFNSYQANDLRKTMFFTDKGNSLANFKGNYSGLSLIFSGFATDEIYLIRAECYARKQDATKAMEVLNDLLVTRWKINTYLPMVAVDAEDALKIILIERRKELVGRGKRWMDLRRLNMDTRFSVTLKRNINNVIYTLPPNDPRYVYPIPDNELAGNSMEQNIR